jgi:hypothetical protein
VIVRTGQAASDGMGGGIAAFVCGRRHAGAESCGGLSLGMCRVRLCLGKRSVFFSRTGVLLAIVRSGCFSANSGNHLDH